MERRKPSWAAVTSIHEAQEFKLELLAYFIFLTSNFWLIPSNSKRVINSVNLCPDHAFSRIKRIDQWEVDQDPDLT